MVDEVKKYLEKEKCNPNDFIHLDTSSDNYILQHKKTQKIIYFRY